MTKWFISRHLGAIEWVKDQNLQVDHFVSHVDIAQIRAGDTVMGSLPVHLVAQVCGCGARYLHLSVDLPSAHRGRELSKQELHQFNARLRPFLVTALPQEFDELKSQP